MKPIVFPRWPERVFFVLFVLSAATIFWIADTAFRRFGMDDARTAFLGGLPAVVGFVVIAFLIRRHRLKTELKATEYGKILQNGVTNG